MRIGPALAVLVPAPADDAPGGGHLRITAAAAALRAATGRDDIRIHRRPSGRPALAPPYPELGVSLSRRAGMLLAAFAPDGLVGADIELDGPDSPSAPAAFAADHYSEGEAAAVGRLSGPGARDLCHRLWAAKEAVLKMSGRGVYDGLAEPDLTPHLHALARDGVAVALPAGPGLPSLRLGVRRLEGPAIGTAYCALAYAAA